MLTQYLNNFWRFFAKPTVRLDSAMYWSLGKVGGVYAVSLLCYIAGSFLPGLVILALASFLQLIDSPYLGLVLELDFTGLTLSVMMVVTFLSGFLAQCWYFNKKLKQDGFSLRKVVGLHLDKLDGSWFKAISYGGITFVSIIVTSSLLEMIPMPEIKDPALYAIREIEGWAFALLALLFILVGPVLEEVVFRGLLYGSIRSSLKSKISSPAWRDAVAALVSATIFAAMHLNLSGFLIYLGLGYILAEAYRRTGSLYPSIIAHCLNNGVGIILFILGK